MSNNTDRAPTRQRLPVAQTTFAKRMGVNRSTISRAMNGPLKAALLPGRRVDVGHPAAVQWARDHGRDPTTAAGQLARILARKRSTPEPAIEEASDDAMSLEEFAERAEVPVAEVRKAMTSELRDAVLHDGRIRAASREALEFMAQRPFREAEDGRSVEPQINGQDFLAPASLPCPMPDHPSAVQVHDHTVLRIWLARHAAIIQPIEELPLS
jgi:hypothetical protein